MQEEPIVSPKTALVFSGLSTVVATFLIKLFWPLGQLTWWEAIEYATIVGHIILAALMAIDAVVSRYVRHEQRLPANVQLMILLVAGVFCAIGVVVIVPRVMTIYPVSQTTRQVAGYIVGAIVLVGSWFGLIGSYFSLENEPPTETIRRLFHGDFRRPE
jgi:hypothetical protein